MNLNAGVTPLLRQIEQLNNQSVNLNDLQLSYDAIKTPIIQKRAQMVQKQVQYMPNYPVIDPLTIDISDYEDENVQQNGNNERNYNMYNENTYMLIQKAQMLTNLK